MDEKGRVKHMVRHSLPSLGGMIEQIKPKATLERLTIPPNTVSELRVICNKFARDGKGMVILFSGASGADCAMAAEAIANELHLGLQRVDLSAVVSKYIGETEKNLKRIFGVAEVSNSILILDEADALFGKRPEVNDSHDRYANIDSGALFQQMENNSGIVILATNRKSNLDEAFQRHLQYIINFPIPVT